VRREGGAMRYAFGVVAALNGEEVNVRDAIVRLNMHLGRSRCGGKIRSGGKGKDKEEKGNAWR